MINRISVIISTYNQPEFLELTLKSFASQRHINYNNCEIIVADDGSKISTKELINDVQINFPCKILHVWHPDDGFRKSSILNKAVIASSGDYLLFVDGDCVVSVDFIANQIKLAEKKYFVAGNRVLLSKIFTERVVNDKLDLQKIPSLSWLFLALSKKTNKLFHWVRLSPTGLWRKLRNNNWRYPKGCNVAVWKEDYIKVNGYEETYTGWGHEDADFFIRLLHSDVRVKDGRFSVPVYHLWHKLNLRDNEQENLKRMMSRADDKSCIRAKLGIEQYC